MRTYKELGVWGREYLKERGIAAAEVDARELLLARFSLDYGQWILKQNESVQDEQMLLVYMQDLERRAAGEPLQYITGKAYFCGLCFQVNPHVLIPRFDTEILVELILQREKQREIRLLDLATGSGCIAIALKKIGQYREVLALDISKDALLTAQENARANAADLEFIESDLCRGLEPEDQFDVMVSNPPYIATDEIMDLDIEVREHEPRLALDGHADGLHFYREIAKQATEFLKAGGRLYLEIGCLQGNAVSSILADNGFIDIEIHRDLAGFERVVCAKKNRAAG